jgi:hypothetical protein
MRSVLSRFSHPIITSSILLVTIVAAAPILAGHWSAIVPYWYNASPLAFLPARLLPGLITIGLYLAGSRLLAGRSGAWSVTWSVIGAVAIPMALLAPVGNPIYVMFTRTVSSQATGGFTLGTALTPAMLRDWPQLMPTWRQFIPHIAISPPGWPLFYYGLSAALGKSPTLSQELANILRPWQCHTWDWRINQVTDPQLASAWFGTLSPLWAALTVPPLYRLGYRMAGEAVAREAVRWWPLVPALALFAGTLNTFYPLLAVLVLYLIWQGIIGRAGWSSAWRLLSAGLLTGLLLLLNLSPAPLLLLVGLLVLLSWRQGTERSLGKHVVWAVAAGIQMGIGVLIVAGAYSFWIGSSPVDAFLVAMRVHMEMHRSYLPSLGLHAWDFVIYTGLALTGLACAYAVMRRTPAISRLALAFAITMGLVLLSGSAQGEVGRVWIFFMPIVVLLAATGLLQLSRQERRIVLGAQVFWLVVLVGSHRPIDTWLGPPPVYADVTQPSLAEPLTSASVRFGDDLLLTGFQSHYQPDRHLLSLALHWQALRQMTTPYYFSIVPVAPDGRALPGTHWQPLGKLYPTTCWRPGGAETEVVDRIDLPLGDAALPGDWWLSLSAFAMREDETLPSLPVHLADGTQDTQFGLGPVRVEGSQ